MTLGLSVWEYVEKYHTFIFDDLFIFIGGMIAGILINGFKNIKYFQEIYISPRFKKEDWNLVRIKGENGKDFIYINPKTYMQTIEAWFAFRWWDLRGRKNDYILEDKKKARILFIISLILAVGFVIYGVFNIFHIAADVY